MEEKPKSVTEIDFFTRQMLDDKGFAFMWVYKPMCPDCGGTRLKKLKKRDKVYVCSECNKSFEKEQYNDLLIFNLEYTCPKCEKKGETSGKWEKPKKKKGTVMLKFVCEHCGSKLKVYRMSKKKKKKEKK